MKVLALGLLAGGAGCFTGSRGARASESCCTFGTRVVEHVEVKNCVLDRYNCWGRVFGELFVKQMQLSKARIEGIVCGIDTIIGIGNWVNCVRNRDNNRDRELGELCVQLVQFKGSGIVGIV